MTRALQRSYPAPLSPSGTTRRDDVETTDIETTGDVYVLGTAADLRAVVVAATRGRAAADAHGAHVTHTRVVETPHTARIANQPVPARWGVPPTATDRHPDRDSVTCVFSA
jgi:hypothetical protein